MTALEKWARDVYGKAASKPGALRKALFRSSSGIEVKPLYSPDEPPPSIGFPGQYPFTRGVQPTMYRGRFWTMRQYAGFGSAEQTNERFHYLLRSGQTGLSTAFDLPTQMGHDSDSARARGEVGRVGVAIDSVDDMERLFKDIDLGQVSTSMTINATAATLLALYQAVGEAHGTRPEALSGTIQNDVLKEYMARGTYIYPPGPSMRLITDTFEYASKVVPKWNPISISGYHIREAGSTAAQEIAFTLGDGIAYVDAAMRRGLDVDSFAGRLSFFFNVHNNFIEEVAKFRAARRLWARTMKERFKAKDPRSWTLRFHAQTAGSTLTAQQPDNNVVRVSLQALAAVLGGCQSLHTNGRDEALSLPTEASARIALRTQQIVAYESGVCDFIDPLGEDSVQRLAQGGRGIPGRQKDADPRRQGQWVCSPNTSRMAFAISPSVARDFTAATMRGTRFSVPSAARFSSDTVRVAAELSRALRKARTRATCCSSSPGSSRSISKGGSFAAANSLTPTTTCALSSTSFCAV